MEKCVEALESGSTELHIEWYESCTTQGQMKTDGRFRQEWLIKHKWLNENQQPTIVTPCMSLSTWVFKLFNTRWYMDLNGLGLVGSATKYGK